MTDMMGLVLPIRAGGAGIVALVWLPNRRKAHHRHMTDGKLSYMSMVKKCRGRSDDRRPERV